MVLSNTFLKAFCVGSLMVSSIGIIAAGVIEGAGEGKNIPVNVELTKDIEVSAPREIPRETPQSTASTVNTATVDSRYYSPLTLGCHIHVVEKPEGYWDGRAFGYRLGTSKVKKDYETRKDVYDLFKGDCDDFWKKHNRRRIYIYYNSDSGKWVGSLALQGKDGIYELGEEGKFENYTSFK